jgi:hypothetical protein
MKLWIQTIMLCAVVFLGVAAVDAGGEEHAIPERGYVPDSETAIRIAEAVWIPIYGDKLIAGEKPFKASLEGETWTVTGSLADGHVGGTAIAEISRRDGRILRVTHEQ